MRSHASDLQAVSIEPLTGSGAALAGLTFPRYRRFVEDDAPARLAIGAWCGGRAVGLALVAWTPELPQARLFSLMVVPDMRRRGIGTGLLAVAEAQAADKGRRSMDTFYSSLLPGAAAFNALLPGAGWSIPAPLELRCAMRAGDVLAAMADWPGIRRGMLLRSRLTYTPWDAQSHADRTAIEHLSAPPACPTTLAPTHWHARFQSSASLILRVDGAIVGWILARLDPPEEDYGAAPMLNVLCAYIRRDLWRSGALVASYHHLAQRHVGTYGPAAPARFSTSPAHPGMMALTRRRFAPAALWVDEWMGSSKPMCRSHKPAAKGQRSPSQ